MMGCAQLHEDCVGAAPPDEKSQDAEKDESQSPKTGKMTSTSHVISRKEKQRQQDFLDMCSSDSSMLPYSVFQRNTERFNADTLEDIRHLALIDLKGVKYQQLPLNNSQLFKVLEKHAETARHDLETEVEYIEAAQKRLHEFAIDPTNAYASNFFYACSNVIPQQCKQQQSKL